MVLHNESKTNDLSDNAVLLLITSLTNAVEREQDDKCVMQYITNKNKEYIVRSICSGELYVPTAKHLLSAMQEYKKHYTIDLSNYFIDMIRASNIFYKNVAKICLDPNPSLQVFMREFEKTTDFYLQILLFMMHTARRVSLKNKMSSVDKLRFSIVNFLVKYHISVSTLYIIIGIIFNIITFGVAFLIMAQYRSHVSMFVGALTVAAGLFIGGMKYHLNVHAMHNVDEYNMLAIKYKSIHKRMQRNKNTNNNMED